MSSLLTPLGPDIWELDHPHTVFGMEMGRRLTAVRLPSGDLWVHASVPPAPKLTAALAALGRVGYIVGPNTFHDAYLEEFVAAYPDAEFHAAPGLAGANPRLQPTHTLGARVPPAWAEVLDQHLVAGVPRLNEVVFLHKPSRTLIVADLAFNLLPPKPWLTRVALTLNDAYGRFTPSRMLKSIIREPIALRASLAHILTWDFDRIVVGHGANIPGGGREALRQAFSFLEAR
jgi:hypothetical protein